MGNWNSIKITKNPAGLTAAASATTVASIEFKLSQSMAMSGVRLLVRSGAKTGAGTVSAILQTKIAQSDDQTTGGAWVDVKSVTPVASSSTYLVANPDVSADASSFPLGSLCRVVVTCAAATSQIVEAVYVVSDG